jgi:hypothetical protein
MFTFKLIQTDGSPADPPQFVTAVPNWHEGDTFLLQPGRVLRIVSIRHTDEETVWTVVSTTPCSTAICFGPRGSEAPWRSAASRGPAGSRR